MSSFEDKWISEGEKWTPKRFKILFVILLVICLFGGAVAWGVGVATSDVRGKGDQIVRNNSESNRTFKQEYFEELYADIQGADTQINNTADLIVATANPEEVERLNVVLLGQKNLCVSLTQEYNAEARKVTSQDWRSADLPQEIPTSDPSFDCEPD